MGRRRGKRRAARPRDVQDATLRRLRCTLPRGLEGTGTQIARVRYGAGRTDNA